MTLPPPVARTPNHTRTVIFDSFEREDGLYDVEARVTDRKHFTFPERERGQLTPGTAQHDIVTRVTFDKDLIVRDIAIELATVPFSFCAGSTAALPGLIGRSLARGWRKSIQEVLGGTTGCTHTRELLTGIPTIAIQTLVSRADKELFDAGGTDTQRTERPIFLGGCHTWSMDSPVVEEYFPQFAVKPE
ncbi:MAG: DUF2889 domain-containing protein [Rhodobiaceae bacterium]|nr:DUF2889 domain-containing protein [Rhodobiaceae bacterium]MCC0056165.1 DUF2889 domain-containing protein [Rhodobiaceae bacterium]